MKHIVFPTYELHPVNPGGAGVLVAGTVRILANAGLRSTVLCDFPDHEVAAANEGFAGEGIADRVKAVSLRSLAKKEPPHPGAAEYETNSHAFARGLRELHERDPIGLIEFPEYAGLGFSALRDRLEGGVLADVRMVVRIHGSLEAIDRAERVNVEQLDRLRMYRMERLGMELGDALLSPSNALGANYRETYRLPEEAQVVLAPPPMYSLLAGLERVERFVDPHHFLFYGKLQEVKGCDMLVEAAVALIAERPRHAWRFTFVGRDVPCAAHGRNFSACLRELIPPRYDLHFEFVPAISRSSLGELARRPLAAVIPSRFETFCLAAHELRAVGLPVIVNDIPAFQDYFNEDTGGVRFDGTAAGLLAVLRRFADNPDWAEALARRPPPSYRHPAQPYLELLQAPVRSAHPARVRGTREQLRSFDAAAGPK